MSSTAQRPGALGSGSDVLDALHDAVLLVDDDGIIVFASRSVHRLLGWHPAELTGEQLVRLIPGRLREAHTTAFARYVAGAPARLLGRPMRLAAVHRDGSEVGVELTLSPGATVGTTIGCLRAVESGVDLSGHGSLAHHLLQVVADRRSDGTDAHRVVAAIGRSLGWDVAALWVVERSIRCLRCDAFWSEGDDALDRFRAAAEGSLLPVGVGIPGAVWETGRATWEGDLPTQTASPIEEAASRAGLITAFAFPVMAGGAFAGVIELLDRRPRTADVELTEVMVATGRLVGEFLEASWHDDERRDLLTRLERERARLAAVQMRMPSAMLIADAPSGAVVSGNDKLSELVGPPQVADSDGERVLVYRFQDALGGAYRHADLPFVRAAATGEVIEDEEYDLQGPDGVCRTVSVSAAPVEDRNGRVVSAVATFHDVSGRSRAAQRHEFLAAVSSALGQSLDSITGLEDLAALSIGVLGDAVSVYLERDGRISQVAAAYRDDRTAAAVGAHPGPSSPDPAATDEIGRVLHTGQSMIYERATPGPRNDPPDPEHRHLAVDGGSALLVPVPSSLGVGGVLSFASLQAGWYDDDTVSLAHDLAQRVATAIDNASLFDRERELAAVLQASLLPRELPDVPGLEMAARFHAAGSGGVVGGDFYDVFRVGDATAVLVGDVCGKGAQAAARTAQFRFTARALSDPECDPATLFDRVDAVVQQQDGGDGRFCTAVYALIEADGHRLACRASSAGHPLPIVVRSTGQVEEVDCGGSLLFALSKPTHSVSAFHLNVGDALVMYTDGVTEARGKDGFMGDAAVHALLATNAGASAREIADAVADAAIAHSGGRTRDDIAVVVVVAR